MRRPLTLPILLLATAAVTASAAAAPLVLNVSEEGWSAVAATSYPGSNARFVEAVNGKIKLPDVPAGAKIYAANPNSNLALVGEPAELARTTIGREGSTYLFRVTVNVTDAPGESGLPYTREAAVSLNDGERTQSQINASGTVLFSWAKIGPVTITVKSRGGDNKTRSVAQKVTLDRDGLSDFAVPVTNEPVPLSDMGTGARTGTTPAPPASGNASGGGGGSAIGNILSTLIGLGVVGGLAFFGWRYVQANPDQAKGLLTKIGADVPKPLDPDDPPAATPATTPDPAPAPSGPIILDPAPTPIAVPSAPISLSSAPTGVPKLFGTDGSAFELPEGETVVGREALGGLMISHDTVSRRHARLVRSGPSVTVEDLGSTNGTWVNDTPAPATLNGGETVRFGQVAYRYEA